MHNLYIYPQVMVSRIALDQKIHNKGVFKKVGVLRREGVLSEEGRNHLLWVRANILLIRLKTYDYYQAQREFVSPLGTESKGDENIRLKSTKKIL